MIPVMAVALKEVRVGVSLAGPTTPGSPVDRRSGAKRDHYRATGGKDLFAVGLGRQKIPIMSTSIVVTSLATIGFQISHCEKFGDRTFIEVLPATRRKSNGAPGRFHPRWRVPPDEHAAEMKSAPNWLASARLSIRSLN